MLGGKKAGPKRGTEVAHKIRSWQNTPQRRVGSYLWPGRWCGWGRPGPAPHPRPRGRSGCCPPWRRARGSRAAPLRASGWTSARPAGSSPWGSRTRPGPRCRTAEGERLLPGPATCTPRATPASLAGEATGNLNICRCQCAPFSSPPTAPILGVSPSLDLSSSYLGSLLNSHPKWVIRTKWSNINKAETDPQT